MNTRVSVLPRGKTFVVEITEPYYNCGRIVIANYGPFRKRQCANVKAKEIRQRLRQEAKISIY